MASLHITLSDSAYRRLHDLRGEVIIGRHDGCSLRIAHRSLSRQQCRIWAKPSGWVVEDLDSTNGTFLNGRRIVRPEILRHQDVIVCGVASLTFLAPEQIESRQDGAPSYQAMEIPSAVLRRTTAVEHRMVGDETETHSRRRSQDAQTQHDHLEIASHQDVIDLDHEPVEHESRSDSI